MQTFAVSFNGKRTPYHKTYTLTKLFLKKMNGAERMTVVILSLERLLLYNYDSFFHIILALKAN